MKVICYCHEQLLRSRQSWGPSINDISMEEGRVRALALGQITLLRGSKCECDKGELRGGVKSFKICGLHSCWLLWQSSNNTEMELIQCNRTISTCG